jgi:hypothetical protein
MIRRARHLTRRFVGAIRPGGPNRRDTAWAEAVLAPTEHELWARMANHDRRHSIAVARRVERALAGTVEARDQRWITAALLHDVGKLDAGLSVVGRVGATFAGALAGHELAEAWSAKRGVTRKFGLYLRHAEIGETRLRVIGARQEAALWAGAHHDRTAWGTLGFPEGVVTALDEADDD